MELTTLGWLRGAIGPGRAERVRDERGPSVPGLCESVIWFMSPVSYEETQLDAELVEDLIDWDRSYYAGLTSERSWRSRALETEFAAAGLRLARRVAAQIGDEFEVEHYAVDGTRERVRGRGPARNPDAASAFRRLAAEANIEWEKMRRVVDQAARAGHPLEWRAY